MYLFPRGYCVFMYVGHGHQPRENLSFFLLHTNANTNTNTALFEQSLLLLLHVLLLLISTTKEIFQNQEQMKYYDTQQTTSFSLLFILCNS